MTDDATVARLVEELQARGPMLLTLKPQSVLHLTGLLQLALRHPGLGESSREIAQTFIAGARDYFVNSPATLDVIRRGDDPSEDR
jgi:hypothetical protein